MSLRLRILVLGAAGFLAGLMIWPALEVLLSVAGTGPRGQAVLGGVAGGSLGLALGGVEALRAREGRRGRRRVALALLLGVAGGATGAPLGRALFARLGGFLVQALAGREELGFALGLAAGWALLGATLGASGGAAEGSVRRACYGAAGGTLGGFAGGLLFATLAGWHGGSAAFALGCLGAAIGAGIAAAEEVLISLRLRVIKGPLKGREYPLVKAVTTLGRDDRCDICLSGQEGVGLLHAHIRRSGEGLTIEKLGEEGIWVNDQTVRRARLQDGDLLRLGSALFLLVACRPAPTPEAARPRGRLLRRLVARLGVGLALLCLLGEPRPAEGETLTLRITQVDVAAFPEVHLYAAAGGASGEPVRGIPPAAWGLLEEGEPREIREAVSLTALGSRRRASVLLLLDKSGSMAGEKLAQAKAALREYVGLLQPGDTVALLAFDEAVHELSDFTGEPAALRRALDAVTAEGNTALGDALVGAVERLRDRPGRRAVVVLSDGIQTRGRWTPEEAAAAALTAQVSLTAIALGTDARRADLSRLASSTGGTFHVAPGPEALARIYRGIAYALRDEYRLTFRSTDGGEALRHLRLTLTHQGLSAGAARAYLRPDAGLFEGAAALRGWGGLLSGLALAGLVTLGVGSRRRPAPGPAVSLLSRRGMRTLPLGPKGLTMGRAGAPALALRPSGTGVVATEVRPGTVRLNHRPLGGSVILQDGDVLTLDGSTLVFETGAASGSTGGRGAP